VISGKDLKDLLIVIVLFVISGGNADANDEFLLDLHQQDPKEAVSLMKHHLLSLSGIYCQLLSLTCDFCCNYDMEKESVVITRDLFSVSLPQSCHRI